MSCKSIKCDVTMNEDKTIQGEGEISKKGETSP